LVRAMSKPLRLAVAALTKNVYVGRVSKDGRTFTDGKQDVTSDFLKAVVDRFEGVEHTIRVDDGTSYTVMVTKVAP
jgi:hypothetical protein